MPNLISAPAVLIVAGTDSSGGAGLLRDVQTLNHLQVDALCAITAITAQSNTGVLGVHHVPPNVIQQQITAAFATRAIGAIKIGMLGNATTVQAVAASLAAHRDIPIVLDPVLMSSSGGTLLDAPGITALKIQLLPKITLLTPNLLEAAALLQANVATNESDTIEQAQCLLELGPQAVLIKGGHAAGETAVDWLITKNQAPLRLSAPRVDATLRGTGCALASTIAAYLTRGESLIDACQGAKRYVLKELLDASSANHTSM